MRRLLAPWTKTLLNTDRKLGLEVLQAWSKHFRTRSSMPTMEEIGSFEDYIRFRTAMFGSEAWRAMLRFALGLCLKREEVEAASPAVKAAMRSVVLTTDYWCWEKVSRDQQGRAREMNAVAFVMAEQECTDAKAKVRVKCLEIEAEKNFVRLASKAKAGQDGPFRYASSRALLVLRTLTRLTINKRIFKPSSASLQATVYGVRPVRGTMATATSMFMDPRARAQTTTSRLAAARKSPRELRILLVCDSTCVWLDVRLSSPNRC